MGLLDEPILWVLLVLVPLLLIEVAALFHVIARRPHLAVARKTGWVAAIVLVPFIGALLYALFRPPGLAAGKATQQHDATRSTMQQLERLASAHDSGAIDDDAYATSKAELFGLGSHQSSVVSHQSEGRKAEG